MTTQPIARPGAEASMTGVAASSSRTRFGFVVAILTQILIMAGASAPSPFYPVLAQRIGFDSTAITVVFAVYALALLATLLTTGSLSDHLGRRPVVVGGLVLLAASMLVFSTAGSVAALVLARVIQGIASGLLLSALSAAVLDFAPKGRAALGALWNALCPGIGLAAGALVAGIVLDLVPDALPDVFLPLAIVPLILAGVFLFVPETAARRPGAWASLSVRVSLPPSIRADFWRAAPAVVAGWATGGLFLSLGASIVHTQLGGAAHVWQGLSVALLAGIGAITAASVRRWSPRTITIFGTAALATGTVLSLVMLGASSLPGYLVAVGVTGMGFGTAFYGVMSSLTPRIPAAARADVFAAVFVLAYVAFGVPAVAAGLLAGLVGLRVLCIGYGAVVIALSLVALVLRIRRAD